MDKDITIDGQRLHYTDTETGNRCIVLMHGWGCNHSTLASVEKVAAGCGYRVVNIDFPGFGQSEEPSGVWGVEEYTRMVEKFISALGIESPTLLGHSFGGRVGILYSSRNKVDKLILVDAAGVKPRRSLKYYWKRLFFQDRKEAYVSFHGKGESRAAP